jgi:hypothetical protein
LKKNTFFLLNYHFIDCTVGFGASSKNNCENSDFGDVNQTEIPDALLLIGNVRVNHDGVVL